jgi:hypothetical protein
LASLIPADVNDWMVGLARQAVFNLRLIAVVSHKRQKLRHRYRIAPDEIPRRRSFMLRLFIVERAWVTCWVTSERERPYWNLGEPEQWLIGRIPGFGLKAWVAKLTQYLASLASLRRGQIAGKQRNHVRHQAP